MKERVYKFETLQLHAGQEEPDSVTDAKAVLIYATTSYMFKDSEQTAQCFALREGDDVYNRLMNPMPDVFERRMTTLESGATVLVTTSGSMAIDYAIRNIATCGGHIVSSSTVHGGTYNPFTNMLTDNNITTSPVDGSNPKDSEEAIQDNTKAMYLESPGSLNVGIVDLEAVSEIVHRHGIPVTTGSTFATLLLLRPLEHGADIVVHSATKFIDRHGTAMGGVTVDRGRLNWEQSDKFLGLSEPSPSYHDVAFTQAVRSIAYVMRIRVTLICDQGACLSPFSSFLLLQGLGTLLPCMERRVENTGRATDFLQKQPKVAVMYHSFLVQGRKKELYKRYYPKGGTSIFAFEIRENEGQTRTFTESLSVFSLLVNMMDVKSFVAHPASTTYSQVSAQELAAIEVTPQTIRLSIGTGYIDDILEDLRQGFTAISAGKQNDRCASLMHNNSQRRWGHMI